MKPGQIVGLVGGVWLMVAPAVVGYVDTAAEDLHRTIGPVVATFAAVALWAATRDLRWANLPLVAVMAIAPVFGGHPTGATVVAITTAVVIAAATPFGGPDPQRRGRGWRGVIQSK